MDENVKVARAVWHGLNNQSLLFNVFKKNVRENSLGKEFIVTGEIPADLNSELFQLYTQKVNEELLARLRSESEEFNVISGRSVTDGLKLLRNAPDKEKSIILLSTELYNKLPQVMGQKEYTIRGTFPGTAVGFITATWNSLPLFSMPNLFSENEMYVVDNDFLFINIGYPTQTNRGYLETQLELVCADPKKHYKIILE